MHASGFTNVIPAIDSSRQSYLFIALIMMMIMILEWVELEEFLELWSKRVIRVDEAYQSY